MRIILLISILVNVFLISVILYSIIKRYTGNYIKVEIKSKSKYSSQYIPIDKKYSCTKNKIDSYNGKKIITIELDCNNNSQVDIGLIKNYKGD